MPTTAVPARWVLSTAAHAVHRARQPAGPVHLNLPYREPLAATPDGTDAAAYLADVGAWAGGGQPWTSEDRPPVRSPGRVAGDGPSLVGSLGDVERGVVVVGELDGDEDQRTADAHGAVEIATLLGWPVLPDVRTALRVGEGDRPVVAYADLVLASPQFRERHRAEAVLHVGGRIVSKRLSRYLAESRPAAYVHVSASPGRLDPDSLVTHAVRAPLADALADALAAISGRGAPARRTADGAWAEGWHAASAAVSDVLADRLDGLSEPAVARETARRSPVLVVAASMPIRDVEAFAAPTAGPARTVVANRGASGIDGTVATAAGVARGGGGPVVLLTGDLALLHDQTSLALLRSGPPVVVVVVNNDGGGIFHRLPVASGPGALAAGTFERFFGTPHGLTFGAAARQVGLAYHRPTTLPAFEAALDAARQSGASALIEVQTDRTEQAALRARIEAAVVEAVDRAGTRGEPLP